ncbi:hypothetical protein GCM10010987_45350 [Bradyrhizobium guangdongense]|uniref:Uncharacterized protein n=1 Tax=Bradyrhizobium guangdongense TaxID=1325090 RepID=A0AA87W673_9BRAD|nr:hypothetical protein GCM10010987_45350 [Bradyrhizobium guangdongense]
MQLYDGLRIDTVMSSQFTKVHAAIASINDTNLKKLPLWTARFNFPPALQKSRCKCFRIGLRRVEQDEKIIHTDLSIDNHVPLTDLLAKSPDTLLCG